MADNPYPTRWDSVTGFQYLTRLELGREVKVLLKRRDREACYVLLADYTVSFLVDGKRRELTVPAGMLTDLVSVPAAFRSVVGRVGPHLEAAIVHDYLYIAWQLQPDGEPRRQDWRFANAVMFAGIKAAHVGWFRRALIWVALTQFSWSVYKKPDELLFADVN